MPDELCYLFPKPNAKWISPQTPIILRSSKDFDSVLCSIRISGLKGKIYDGRIKKSTDGRIIIFQSFEPFSSGETIDVQKDDSYEIGINEGIIVRYGAESGNFVIS